MADSSIFLPSPRFPPLAHVHAGEELPGAGAAERRQNDQRAAQRTASGSVYARDWQDTTHGDGENP